MGNAYKVLATSIEEAKAFEEMAESMGTSIDGSVVWEGPVPPNSYMYVNQFMRMSTPEFFLFRKMSQSDDVTAMNYACEMFSRVQTGLTCGQLDDSEYVKWGEPQTTMEAMCEYLQPINGDPLADRCFLLMATVCVHDMMSLYEAEIGKNMRKVELD